MKKAGVLVGLLVFGAGMFYMAYEVGSSRNVYDVTYFDRLIPVPIILDVYSGSAEDLGQQKIKAQFAPASPPVSPSKTYFNCLGSFKVRGLTVYLLEIDSALYIEKSEFVEPLIQGVCELSLGLEKGTLDKASISEIITQLPTEVSLLESVAGRFKSPQNVDDKPARRSL